MGPAILVALAILVVGGGALTWAVRTSHRLARMERFLARKTEQEIDRLLDA